jgi:sugar phosphate isomerase/epimerase
MGLPDGTGLVLAARTILVDDLRVRAALAAAAGYSGLGLRYDDYAGARNAGLSDDDMRALLMDHGLEVVEIQSVQGWAGGPEERAAARRLTAECLQVADALGGRYLSINATSLVGNLDDAAAGFSEIADLAAQHGLLAALEYLPWGPVPDARTAWEVVRRAGCQNGRILVDSWHHFKGGADYEDIRAVPSGRICGVQFSDGTADIRRSLADDSRNERLYPGDGVFDLIGFVRALDAMGVTGPYSVEVLSTRCRATAPAVVAREAALATVRIQNAARGTGQDPSPRT